MACPDLCTAEKCQELEARIENLEAKLENLQVAFDQHTLQQIPVAHDYNPSLEVDVGVTQDRISVGLTIDGVRRSDSDTLPSYEPEVSLDILDNGDNQWVFLISVNGVDDEDTLILPQLQTDEDSGSDLNGSATFADGILTINISDRESETTFDTEITSGQIPDDPNSEGLSVNVSYLLNFLTVQVSHNGNSDSDTVYINTGIIDPFRGGGNNGGDDMGCQQIGEQIEQDLGEILAAINAVGNQVQQVKDEVTVEVSGTTVVDYLCPEPDEEDSTTSDRVGREQDYTGRGMLGLHSLLKFIDKNLRSIFKTTCELEPVAALPSWWQVRLGADVPQIVCTFRKSGTRTYHDLCIPHPANTEKPTRILLPFYAKGNWQGMIICRDNSKFIINCKTKAEAKRMCEIALTLINPAYLEQPPRIHYGERKGQAVSVNDMIPSTINYFANGQRHTVPNWRVSVKSLE